MLSFEPFQTPRPAPVFAILKANRVVANFSRTTPVMDWRAMCDGRTREENEMAMVGLANHHSFPHTDWTWSVVGDGHLYCAISHIALGNNDSLQEQFF